MSITVYGAGAIGGIAGGKISLAGEQVTFVDKVQAHVEKINKDGLLINGINNDVPIKVQARRPDELEGELDLILLCVKAQDTEPAMKTLMPHIGPQTTIVSLQNGLNETFISDIVGPQRTIGCLVNWSGDFIDNGHILFGGEGPMRVGTLNGNITDTLVRIKLLLEHVAPTSITQNILGFLWSKVIWGCFYIGNALGKATVIEMLEDKHNQPILLDLFKEGVKVAESEAIMLEPLMEHCFNPAELARLPQEKAIPIFNQMAKCFEGHRKVYSGPWRDVAVRKRATEVDHIIGPIVRIGTNNNIPTPLNSRLVTLIKEIERGERGQDNNNLRDLESLM